MPQSKIYRILFTNSEGVNKFTDVEAESMIDGIWQAAQSTDAATEKLTRCVDAYCVNEAALNEIPFLYRKTQTKGWRYGYRWNTKSYRRRTYQQHQSFASRNAKPSGRFYRIRKS